MFADATHRPAARRASTVGSTQKERGREGGKMRRAKVRRGAGRRGRGRYGVSEVCCAPSQRVERGCGAEQGGPNASNTCLLYTSPSPRDRG
eukprot:596505-Rhodomonas_salina.1